MIIDHLSLSGSDFVRARTFYSAALAPLKIKLMMEFPAEVAGEAVAGFGRDKPELWISQQGKATPRVHLAFAADDREMVDAFYKAAIAAGGADNGGPGPRPIYHEHYYGAFVLDFDGNNIEAVCHRPVPGFEGPADNN